MATATRTGMSGSLRCGIDLYPYQPHKTVPMSSTHAICRCSTKKRAVLWVFSMNSASLLCGMELPPHSLRFLVVQRDPHVSYGLAALEPGHGITLTWSP